MYYGLDMTVKWPNHILAPFHYLLHIWNIHANYRILWHWFRACQCRLWFNQQGGITDAIKNITHPCYSHASPYSNTAELTMGRRHGVLWSSQAEAAENGNRNIWRVIEYKEHRHYSLFICGMCTFPKPYGNLAIGDFERSVFSESKVNFYNDWTIDKIWISATKLLMPF